MSSKDEPAGVERITATPGTQEHEHQLACQRNDTVQRIARIPLVRVICGVLALLYLFIVVVAGISDVRSQLESGFSAWDTLGLFWYSVIMWWAISMQGRVALYGEFDTTRGLFAPREQLTNRS